MPAFVQTVVPLSSSGTSKLGARRALAAASYVGEEGAMLFRNISDFTFSGNNDIRRTCFIVSEAACDLPASGSGPTTTPPPVSARCTTCGKEVGATKKFCRYCGASLLPVRASVVPSVVVCPNCSSTLSSGKRFCKKCGYRLTPPSLEQDALITASQSTTSRPTVPSDSSVATTSLVVPEQNPSVAIVASDAERPSSSIATAQLPTQAAVLEKSPASAVTSTEAVELHRARPAETKTEIRYWLAGAVIAAGLLSGFAWFIFWSPEARLFRAAEKGDLVTPEGSSAYDYYKQIKSRGLKDSTRIKLRNQVFPKLLSTGDAVFQKRSEGTSMKRAEFKQLANLYEFAADVAPNEPKALSRRNYTQGTLALLDGNLPAALQSFKRSLDYDSNWAPAFNDLGKVYVRLNDYYHAEESYQRAIQVQPNWVFPQLNLAGIYLVRKDWQRAEQAYTRATELDRTLATTWYFLGQTYEGQARFSDAIDAYEHAIQLAATRPSSAFHVDAVQNRVLKLQRKMGAGSR